MLTVLSRSSELAINQVREIFNQLPDITYSNVSMDTYGDNHKELSLLDNQKSDFFTDTIDDALLSGKGDIAIHSAKDLPQRLNKNLEVIALTKCIDSTDSLVTRNNYTLETLPSGSRIGTSSITRKANINSLRKDLEIVSIRGTIQERIAQLDNGTIEALIVATCALKRLNLDNRISEILPFSTHPLQGMLAVVAKKHSPALKNIFFKIDNRKHYGKVWIIGAGPGDPSLLTLKADSILKSADVICIDDLVNQEIGEKYQAEKIYIGKRKNRHSTDQNEINKLLYNLAIEGKTVARLKGGDPLIFGRGGEEIDYLLERFISVEVVPGISAAQASAASMLLPLTHRGVADSLSFISGHSAKDLSTNGKSFAVYMGATSKKEVVDKLVVSGIDTTSDVALIRNASLPDSKQSIIPFSSLAEDLTESPLLMITGPVAKKAIIRDKVLFTGIDPYKCNIDGTIIHYPLIATHPIETQIIDTRDYSGVIFTSKYGVRHFFSRYSLDSTIPIYTIGHQTSQELKAHGYTVTGVPAEAHSDSLASYLLDKYRSGNFLYPCSSLSKNRIHELPFVKSYPIYKTVPVQQKLLDLLQFSSIVFTSPSTVDTFFSLYKTIPEHITIYIYGPFTGAKLISYQVNSASVITISLKGQNE